MDFRVSDLENFIATASCRTLSEGARKRGITQPSMSESIRRLEADLGCKLLYRAKEGISLTPSGRVIFDRGRQATEALIELGALRREKGAFSGRRVTIGCHFTVASYSLPATLLELSKSAPDFRIDLVHNFSRTVQAQIQAGQVDVGIIVNPTRIPDLVIRKLASDTVAVWTAQRGKAQHRLICDPELFQVQAILRKWRSCPRNIISTANLELVARLTGSGLGLGILPSRAVALYGVKLRKVAGTPTYTDEIAVVHRPEFGRLPYEKQVLAALLSSLS